MSRTSMTSSSSFPNSCEGERWCASRKRKIFSSVSPGRDDKTPWVQSSVQRTRFPQSVPGLPLPADLRLFPRSCGGFNDVIIDSIPVLSISLHRFPSMSRIATALLGWTITFSGLTRLAAEHGATELPSPMPRKYLPFIPRIEWDLSSPIASKACSRKWQDPHVPQAFPCVPVTGPCVLIWRAQLDRCAGYRSWSCG